MKSATSILFRSRSFLLPVVLTAAKFVIVGLTLLCWSHESVAQTKVKTKDIKRAIEEGTLSKVEVICADTFKPGEKFSFDIQITMPDNSTTALGNDHDVIYKEAKIVIEKGTLSWDKRGEIKVHPVSVFFPDKGLDISVELGGLTTNKSVKPDFCYPFGYTINRKGQAGKKGSKGDPGPKSRPGSPGGPGTNGGSGANVVVQVEEEVIGDKTYMILLVNDEKHGFETGCGQVTLDVSGGDGGDGGKGGEGGDAPYGSNSKRSGPGGAGGNGGNGGDGGDGGNVTIGGPAYQKYRTMINIVSNGGPGGTFGFPGYHGSGAPNGAAGKVGLVGKSGKPGTITIKQ